MPSPSLGSLSSVRLVISIPMHTAALVVVETSIGVIVNGSVSAGNPVTVDLEPLSGLELEVYTSTDRHNGGVRVYTPNDEPLFLIGEHSYYIEGINHKSFLAYPCLMLDLARDYVYYAISVSARAHNSQLLLVGCEDNTLFTISPTRDVSLPSDLQNESSPLVSITAGSSSNELHLNQMQTLLISSPDDLTGTKIISNKPLTVISGNQCGGSSDPTVFACVPLAVQIPPLATWSTRFLLAPFSGRNSAEQFFKVVAATQTSINITCGDVSYLNLNIIQHEFNSSEYCFLESMDPLLVFQISSEEGVDTGGDSAVALISPTSGYVNEVSITVLPSDTFPSTYLSITALVNDINILINNETMACSWCEIENSNMETVGYGCSTALNVSAGSSPRQYTIKATNDGLFSVLVYGFNNATSFGYAYLGGQVLAGRYTFTIDFVYRVSFKGTRA